MINRETFSSIKNKVAMMVDEVVSSNMFNDEFWAGILNQALAYIYGYHKWSWNVVKESITITDSNELQLLYPIQEIVLVKDNQGKEYKQGQYLDDNNDSVFIIDGDKVIFNGSKTGSFTIIYRRWFKEYEPTDGGRQLDIPFYLNNAVMSLMQFHILPIWLGEGSGGLMNNYLQNAIQQLERMKQIDTYAEPQRNLLPKRR